MKSEKSDKMQAPGARKDAKAAIGEEVAAADKIRTTRDKRNSEGECAPELPVTHEKIPRPASVRNATSANTHCEFLDFVKHMMRQLPKELLASTLKQMQTIDEHDEPCANPPKARRAPDSSGMSFGLCDKHLTFVGNMDGTTN